MSLSLHRCSLSILLLSLPISSSFANDVNTGGQLGVVRTLSTETLGATGITLGGAAKYATETAYVAGPRGETSVIDLDNNRPIDRTAPHLISGDLFFGYGLTSFWDVAVDLPLYHDVPGWKDERHSGIGDLELTTKMAYPFGRDSAWLTSAYSLKVLFPTGSTSRGFFPRHVYYLTAPALGDSDAVFALRTVYFNPQMIWTIDFSRFYSKLPLLFHANFGGVLATKKSHSALVAALALELRPHPAITLFVEASGESRVKWYAETFSVKNFINDPFRVTPGLRLNLPGGAYMILAGDIGIAKSDDAYRTDFSREGYAYSTKSVPKYGAQFAFGWQGIAVKPDRDHDGIPDKSDCCPGTPEDIDGFSDGDGCPDFDNDNDGVPDVRDSCPLSPAICSGCPILDADGDGINDDADQCPKDPEDRDGYNDNDGCPDPDNDNDGILDQNDQCPQMAEDADGFEDGNGCPDLDNDVDGILDTDDKCPGIRGVPENSGCPKTEEIKRGRLILEGVNFQSGKAVLTATSYAILDRVYESLAEWENVRLEIRGHTDNIGSEELNLNISQARANAVMQYLIQRGIAVSRLQAMGFGESSPIADNTTADGRAINRRVEMKRID